MTEIIPVKITSHEVILDVRNLRPKMAVTWRAAMNFDVETMRFETVDILSSTNTVMDRKQWAAHIGPVILDSRHVQEFARTTECPCDIGGNCCKAKLTLRVTNESDHETLRVYTDDLIHTDPRVRPVHRSFWLQTLAPQTARRIHATTTEKHTFSDGDVVCVLEADVELPKFCRAIECDNDTLVLEPLFGDQQFANGIEMVQKTEIGQHVGRITKRQVLYNLGPLQTISFEAKARKGTAREWVKWAPGKAYYRPLFRDMRVNQTIKAKMTRKQRSEFANSCPKRVFDIEGDILDADACDACRQCVDWAKDADLDGLVELPKKKRAEWHRFYIKSTGSIDAMDIAIRALEIMYSRLGKIAEEAGAQLEYPSLPGMH